MSYRNYSTGNSHIVDPSGNGDFTTIASALTAASSGQTIFIRPGTYTENLTLKAGVNLAAFTCDAFTANVTIVGKCSFSSAGTVSISGIRLQTNSDYLLEVTGSVASIVNLTNCYLNATNNTGINFTSSSGSSTINIFYSLGDLGTTGINFFTHSSAGLLLIQYSYIKNSGLSSTASTISSGEIHLEHVRWLAGGITGSGTSSILSIHGNYATITAAVKTVMFTFGGSGVNTSEFDEINTDTASCISISSGARVHMDILVSNNAHAVTGAGTVNYAGLSIPVGDINTSTINKDNFYAGTVV